MRKESSNIFDHEELAVVNVNLNGPYAHGVWSSPQCKVGNEEALEGRSEAIVSNFVETIRSAYSNDEIRNMTLVDVGCYDGFLTTEIEKRLPFKKIIGIEPRGKNIKKGETVRKFLSITTNIDFIETDLDGLVEGNFFFDIVFCSGVFHHLEDLAISTKKLRTIVKQAIYLETQCYPDESNSILGRFLGNLHLRRIEPKDIVYKFLLKTVGIVGTKFESNYYDGSSSGFSLVSLASPTHLLMLLKASNFVEERITLDPVSYKKK
jgi:SAM-dependent methyltransferase